MDAKDFVAELLGQVEMLRLLDCDFIDGDDHSRYYDVKEMLELQLHILNLTYLVDVIDIAKLQLRQQLFALCLKYDGNYLGTTGIDIHPKIQMSIIRLTCMIPG